MRTRWVMAAALGLAACQPEDPGQLVQMKDASTERIVVSTEGEPSSTSTGGEVEILLHFEPSTALPEVIGPTSTMLVVPEPAPPADDEPLTAPIVSTTVFIPPSTTIPPPPPLDGSGPFTPVPSIIVSPTFTTSSLPATTTTAPA